MPAEPGVAEFVVDQTERVVARTRVDVIGPHRTAFVEVLVRVDDAGHTASCPTAALLRQGLQKPPPAQAGGSPLETAAILDTWRRVLAYPLAVIADAAIDVCSSRARLRLASSTRIVVMCRMIEKGTR